MILNHFSIDKKIVSSNKQKAPIFCLCLVVYTHTLTHTLTAARVCHQVRGHDPFRLYRFLPLPVKMTLLMFHYDKLRNHAVYFNIFVFILQANPGFPDVFCPCFSAAVTQPAVAGPPDPRDEAEDFL